MFNVTPSATTTNLTKGFYSVIHCCNPKSMNSAILLKKLDARQMHGTHVLIYELTCTFTTDRMPNKEMKSPPRETHYVSIVVL